MQKQINKKVKIADQNLSFRSQVMVLSDEVRIAYPLLKVVLLNKKSYGRLSAQMIKKMSLEFNTNELCPYLLNEDNFAFFTWIRGEYNEFFKRNYIYMNEYERDTCMFLLSEFIEKVNQFILSD